MRSDTILVTVALICMADRYGLLCAIESMALGRALRWNATRLCRSRLAHLLSGLMPAAAANGRSRDQGRAARQRTALRQSRGGPA